LTGPRREREIKVAVADLDRVRERVRAAGGRLERAAAMESNWVFDRRGVPPSGRLRTRRELLRLRTDGGGSRLTWKSAPEMRGGVKERTEHEFAVDDPAAARLFLESLGFEVTARYEKVREGWLLLGCEVALDRTPVGDFVEVEQVDPNLAAGGIERVCRRCGMDPERADPRDYLAIYRDHRARHEGLPRDMVFGEGRPSAGASKPPSPAAGQKTRAAGGDSQ
jgi:adenylate cyclase class 2